MSHGSAIFQVKDKCTSLVGSRNKLDHSEKKYGLPYQGLKLRKYFRGQVGPHQINFGSPHNLLGAHQARTARLTPRLQGALRRGVR